MEGETVTIETNAHVESSYATVHVVVVEVSGPPGTTACIDITFPKALSPSFPPTIFLDGNEIPEHELTITEDAAYWLIHYEFTLSTHRIMIAFLPRESLPVGGESLSINPQATASPVPLAPVLGAAALTTALTISGIYIKRRKAKQT